jgi:hypothetical protein
MPKPTRRKSLKSKIFHLAPDDVCGRAFALPVDVSLSGECVDWGPQYTAKVRLPEQPKPPKPLAYELSGALSGGAE